MSMLLVLLAINMALTTRGQKFGIGDQQGLETTSSDGWRGIERLLRREEEVHEEHKSEEPDKDGSEDERADQSIGSGLGYIDSQDSFFKEPEIQEVTKVVPVHKTIKVPVPRTIHHPIHIPVPVKILDPYPVHIPVPVAVEKIVQVPVERIVEYKVEKPVPVVVEKIVHVPAEKFASYKVEKSVPVKVVKTVRAPVSNSFLVPLFKFLQ